MIELITNYAQEIVFGLLGGTIFILSSALMASAKLIITVVDAVEDENVSKEETKEIIESAKKAAGAWKLVWNRIKSFFGKKK